MTFTQIWVVPNENLWKITIPWFSKEFFFKTKEKALEKAIEIAKRGKLELIIQWKDWKIQSRNSYWNDPFPPKW